MRRKDRDMELTTKAKVEVSESFVKEAFCITEDVLFIDEPMDFPAHFRCVDAKRGVFFVAWKPKEEGDKT